MKHYAQFMFQILLLVTTAGCALLDHTGAAVFFGFLLLMSLQ